MNIAILGSRMDLSKDKPPYWKPGWECWVPNALYGDTYTVQHWLDSKKGLPYQRWFELHTRRWLQKHYGVRGLARHCRALDTMGIPVYVWDSEEWPELRHAERYPKAEVEAQVPHGRYHAGSFDWMLSFAICLQDQQDPGEIHLYGMDLGPLDGEPLSARSCLEYWAGVAEGRGIPVVAHGGSLFTIYQLVQSTKQYGAEDVDNVLKVAPKRARAVGVRL